MCVNFLFKSVSRCGEEERARKGEYKKKDKDIPKAACRRKNGGVLFSADVGMFSIYTNKSLINFLEKKKESYLADVDVRRGVRSSVLELLVVVGAFLARLRESHIFKALITKAVVRELVVDGLAHQEAC